jgi:primosomal protein N' (replication factor Y) (superfamily II helicase)
VEKETRLILRIALDTPLRRVFDYLPLNEQSIAPPLGVRVSVPFGRRKLVGVLVATAAESAIAASKLRSIHEVLDSSPIFDAATFELLKWAADYYHHPIGEVFAAALPKSLRSGQAAIKSTEFWSLTDLGREQLAQLGGRRAAKQRALLAWLAEQGRASAAQVAQVFKPAPLRALAQHGWIIAHKSPIAAPQAPAPMEGAPQSPPAGLLQSEELTLSGAQAEAVKAIVATLSKFVAHLLYGVTGSGKTEVYMRAISAAIAADGQALVLVPEIALTPQLLERFQRRFGSGVAALHSALTDSERRDAWRSAHSGVARIIIGTRSAVFTSLPRLALIVVDEEHDPSYKQQEGFRYSARDLAVMRARGAGVPIILGSATPSLETLENAATGRYARHLLPHRPGAAQDARMSLIDLRRHATDQGLSTPAATAIAAHLRAGGQVIVFLNRRGYAPSLFCNSCGWVASCEHCDARMTLHRRAQQLRCHHCGAHAEVPTVCGRCRQALLPIGQGTERVEETLSRMFPDASLARLDRDTAAARGSIQTVLERVHSGEARILIGTQMLTKGHHFPDVSLVVILNADQGLFASDFRATERLAQTITQVAGRAGRAARAGEVLIQTEYPEHPLLTRLIIDGYESFAASALEERREAHWPPFSRLAMLRAEAKDRDRLAQFLQTAAERGLRLNEPGIKILGPATALLARRADYFRAHLLIETATRAELQRYLARWLPAVEDLPGAQAMRWSIDVDPLEVD